MHPNLYEGVKTFTKYIGGDSKEDQKRAKEHLELIGLKVKILKNSVTTEIGKLLSTSYYGVCIAWHNEMKELCDKYEIDFEEVVADFNKSYNKGYKKLGKENVIRPILYPALENKIGGHCVIPNAKIIDKLFDSKALDLILKYS